MADDWQERLPGSGAPPQAHKADIKPLTAEEAHRLIDVAEAEDTTYADVILMAIHTGLRMGELLAVSWDDVDTERGKLTVRLSLQQLPGQKATLRKPKSAGSQRTIPLGPTATRLLSQARRRQLRQRLAAGPAYEEGGLVFSTALGTPLGANNVRRILQGMLARAGVREIRFHDLRHTHATLLLMRGVHPKIVAERLGHANIAITLDTYSHVLPNLQEEAVRDLDAWLSEGR